MMKRFLDNYSEKKYDLIVIGGGISGATVAYEAASRGLSVALVERQDFGCATSAATSKMIHGGMRYLANLEFRLVRESLKERRTLNDIAPNLVYPLPYLLTTSKKTVYNSRPILKMFMVTYDLLSLDKILARDRSKRVPMHRFISREKLESMEPITKTHDLTGAYLFYDAISIFPERLTLAVIKSAVARGADVANYAQVDDFITGEQKRIEGLRIKDFLNDRHVDIRGDVVINCGGPWADIILNLLPGSATNRRIRRSEGIHIITRKMVTDYAVSLWNEKGQVIFLIPWRGHTLIGLTDEDYAGNPDDYKVTRESVEKFLRTINSVLKKDQAIHFDDIVYSYGGLRPLVETGSENVRNVSRKYEIYDHSRDGLQGLLTVEGGKYTTSRALAEKVVEMAGVKLHRKLPKSVTSKDYLYGCAIKDIEEYIEKITKEHPDFDARTVAFLGRHYGTDYHKVLRIAREDRSLAKVVTHDGEILAQVSYAIREEMAKSLRDVLFRRTGIGFFLKNNLQVLEQVAAVVAQELQWDQDRTMREMDSIRDGMKPYTSQENSNGSIAASDKIIIGTGERENQ